MIQPVDYSRELIRIAGKTDDEKDADILRAAAFKLAPQVEPKLEKLERIPGFGPVYMKWY